MVYQSKTFIEATEELLTAQYESYPFMEALKAWKCPRCGNIYPWTGFGIDQHGNIHIIKVCFCEE
jgi:hypothetical protein